MYLFSRLSLLFLLVVSGAANAGFGELPADVLDEIGSRLPTLGDVDHMSLLSREIRGKLDRTKIKRNLMPKARTRIGKIFT